MIVTTPTFDPTKVDGYGGIDFSKYKITNPAINRNVGTGSGIDILQLFLTNFITLALMAAGVLSFTMLLWGGISYITAGGDKEATQNAAKKISAALIGLVIAFSVFAIIKLVDTTFGTTITEFKIPIIGITD